MLFNEIYSSYFNVVADVLSKACEGKLEEKDIIDIVQRKAFGESILNIPYSIKSQEWKLLTNDMKTPLLSVPTMPLTTLQKQWLKALSQDPRVKLFSPSFEGLENVEPLYRQEWIEYYDRYNDGDNYYDEKYVENFHTVLRALHENKRIIVTFKGRKGQTIRRTCIPYKLEYSSKDDKFRLMGIVNSNNGNNTITVNMSRMKNVKLLGSYPIEEYRLPETRSGELVIELTNERNCLERFMLHFSHLEKKAKRIEKNKYRINMKYDRDDETEILIRIISFGPMVKVVSPNSFINLIKERLKKQNNLNENNV